MTKSQTIYYVAIVIIITFLAYLYTTVVNAPEANVEVPEADVVEVSESEVVPEGSVESAPAAPVTLPNTSWRYDYTLAADQSLVLSPKTPDAFILSFDGAGGISSQTDCNTLGGAYTQSGTALSFGALASTRMFCEGSDEVAYSTQLSQVESVDFSLNTVMRLNLKNGAGVMYFSKAVEVPEGTELETPVAEVSL